MKLKAISILMAILLCTTFIAIAEEYTLHSGITFGMMAEEAIEKQLTRGNSFEMIEGRLTSTKKIQILSMPATIYYDFDANGGIRRQQYRFDKSEFYDLVQEFVKVYGVPNAMSAENTTLALPEASFTGPFPSDREYGVAAVGIDSYLVTYSSGSMFHAQWLVEVDGGNVVIEIYGKNYTAKVGKNPTNNIGACCLVDYRFFTTEEMEEAQQKNAERYNDI